MSTVHDGGSRYSRRHALPDAPAVHDMLGDRVLGRAVDLSAGGMKLLVAESLPVDTLYQVRFPLQLAKERVEVVAGIQVLDERVDDDGLRCVGARFIHLEGAGARHIVQWLGMQAARG